MYTDTWSTSHTAAHATLDLVGRENICQKIGEELSRPTDGKARLIFLSGIGGIGKTYLLQETLRMAKKMNGMRVARQIIDFYHIHTHTSTGLAHAMFETITPPTKYFEAYEDAYGKLKRLMLSNDPAIDEQRRAATDAFVKGLKELGKTTRVVIALDTSERLVYGAQGMEQESTQNAESWEWLSENLDQLDNIVIVLAGRPEESQPLFKDKNIQVSTINIGGFSLEESLMYFDAVEKYARIKQVERTAQRVAALTPSDRSLAHKCAEGRPILLALLVDYLSTGGSSALLEKSSHEFESAVIGAIMETPQLGDTIRIIGRVRKGISSELFAYILAEQYNNELNPEQAKKDFTAYLLEAAKRIQSLSQFSFVKIRPSDNRLFLHDEAYALLDRHVYNKPQDEPEKEIVYRAINHFYEDQFAASRKKMEDIFKPIEENRDFALDETRVTEAILERQSLLTEDVYYNLRDNAARGYRRYYRYAREAILSNDSLLDIQLQLEMLAFVAEKVTPARLAGEKFIDGLDITFIDWAMILRPITRDFANTDYDKAIAKAEQARIKYSDMIDGDVFKAAGLASWEAYARIYKGDDENRKVAADLLNHALVKMQSVYESISMDESRNWRAQAIMAFAYRLRGYLSRIQNEIKECISDYKAAARLVKNIDLKVELATIYNDLGFALAEQGNFSDARALALRGLTLRRELLSMVRVAYSLNTLALIDMREGYYQKAMREATSALGLFRVLKANRGIGMALTALSETERRHAGSLAVGDVNEKVDWLRKAYEHAQAALRSLTEEARRVEAYIEWGSACRDWVALRKNYPNNEDDLEHLILEGKDAFLQAIGQAGKGLLHRKIDARVNMAWLSYYAGEGRVAFEQACQQAEDEIPAEYKTLKKSDVQLPEGEWIWTQLGKIHMLRGNMAFDSNTYETGGELVISNPNAASEIATYYFWGLQYNANYSNDHQGIRLAKDNFIYPRLAALDATNLRLICDEISNLEKKYQLVDESEIGKMLKARVLWQE